MPLGLDINPDAVIKRIQERSSLLDILIQIEDFFDSLDLYSFENWIDGAIVGGPDISRYWIRIVLKYPYRKMPDPRGAMRLIDKDCQVNYEKNEELRVVQNTNQEENTPKLKRDKIWLFEIWVPRRFIDEIFDQELELYGDDIDVEDVSDAKTEGLSSQESLKKNSKEGDSETDTSNLAPLE